VAILWQAFSWRGAGMAETGEASGGGRRRVDTAALIRRFRLASGLLMLGYVSTHLVNHALGMWSLDLLGAGRTVFLALWRNPTMTLLLYGAVLLHLSLAFWAVYRRDRLRAMSRAELLQLVLGLLIPVLLVSHVIGTRWVHEAYGVDDSYVYELLVLWQFAPNLGVWQAVALLVAWTHGCIGLHLWLRFRPGYRRWVPLLYATAVLLPTLALAGYIGGGMEVRRLAADPAWLAGALARINLPGRESSAHIVDLILYWRVGFLAALALVLVLRHVRLTVEHRRRGIAVTYPSGQVVPISPGTSILDASRGAGIPHASVCGGRGRCGSGRSSSGLDALPMASEAEAKVLERVGAAPNVRLACQTRPVDDVEVTPLLPPQATMRDAMARPSYTQGKEREIVVLFADIRGFTNLSEQRLPYDVVFILNRYFTEMGRAIELHGGRIDKFIGDGIMALFGVEQDYPQACRAALAAAKAMGENLVQLNESLSHDLNRPLRIGIGIHGGPVIIGELGYRETRGLTAIGDTVNTASRLETMTKDHMAQLIVSESVATAAGVDLSGFAAAELEIRGRRQPMTVHVIDSAAALPL
jgi:adenylate cyclase